MSAATAAAGPRRRPRTRRVLWGVGALAVAGGVVGGFAGLGRTPHHLHLVTRAGGLRLVHGGGKPLQAEIASSLAQAFLKQGAKGVVTGVYAKTAAVTEGVTLAGSDAGAFADPGRQVQQYADAQVTRAAQNGFSVPAAGRAATVPPGARGGRAACATTAIASEGIPFSVCAWVDRDTDGFALANDLTPSQLGATLAAMRVDAER